MNRKRLNVLAGICMVCILIIIGEFLYNLWIQKHLFNSTNTMHAELSLDEMPVIDLLQQPETSYIDLVSRPLFTKGRRPVKEFSQETSLTAGSFINTYDWQLNGIYTTPKGPAALFSHTASKTPKNAYRKLTVGTDLDGWKVTQIYKDRVLLEQNNQPKALFLQKQKSKELSKIPSIPEAVAPNTPPPNETPNPFNPFIAPNNP